MKQKKKNIFLSLSLFVVVLLIAANANAYTISYYVKDAYWEFYGNPLDHTYSCVYGNCYAIEDSTTSGGDLWGAYYLSWQGVLNSICASGCYMEWGTHGTCHQYTNRMLFYAYTTISSSIQGYTLSKAIYGTWGNNFDDCVETCGDN